MKGSVLAPRVHCRQKGVQTGRHTQANGRPSPWSRPAQTSDSFIQVLPVLGIGRNRLRQVPVLPGDREAVDVWLRSMPR